MRTWILYRKCNAGNEVAFGALGPSARSRKVYLHRRHKRYINIKLSFVSFFVDEDEAMYLEKVKILCKRVWVEGADSPLLSMPSSAFSLFKEDVFDKILGGGGNPWDTPTFESKCRRGPFFLVYVCLLGIEVPALAQEIQVNHILKYVWMSIPSGRFWLKANEI